MKPILFLLSAAMLVGCVDPSPPAATPAPGYVLPGYVLTNNLEGGFVAHGPVTALGGATLLGPVVIDGRMAVPVPLVIGGITNWVFSAQPLP